MESRPLRVLIAEDDVLVALLTEHELLDVGVLVVGTAGDGREAVDLTCALKPDAVLMDVQMPRMNGIEASKEIQRRHPTPIVLVTAYSLSEAACMAEEAGAGAYLTKPARGLELLEAIQVARARFVHPTRDPLGEVVAA